VLREPVVEALEGLVSIRIGGAGKCLGVAEGGLVVEVETAGAVVEL
jgi:hypothetical protein